MNWIISFIIIIFILILAYLFMGSSHCVQKCVNVHSEKGLNYPWLNHIHGGLDFIDYKEKAAGAYDWTKYTEKTWNDHCAKISHDPDNLVEAHRQAFLVPNSPIKLRFHFKDGTVEELSDNPAHIGYYHLEANYFKQNNICKNQKNDPHVMVNP